MKTRIFKFMYKLTLILAVIGMVSLIIMLPVLTLKYGLVTPKWIEIWTSADMALFILSGLFYLAANFYELKKYIVEFLKK